MKKIEKSISFATEFQKWYETKGKNIEYHSTRKFYNDVLAQLLINQNGLCAYTEDELVTEEKILNLKQSFVEGKFTEFYYQHKHIHIDHFNPDLNKTDGWNFDNLFAVLSYINHNKLADSVDNILKPDSNFYNPIELLEYDCKNHIFFAHSKLEDTIAESVDYMIDTLGMNYEKIKNDRKEYIESHKLLGKQEVRKFTTAFEMCKSKTTKPFKV